MPSPAMPAATSSNAAEPCVIVIFGASGDLTHRKLIPSLYDLERQGVLPKGTVILGVSRTPLTDDQFREKLAPSVEKFSAHYETGRWRQFAQRVHYQPGDAADSESYAALMRRISDLAQGAGISKPCGLPNLLFYLSVSPDLYEPIVEAIGAAGMVTEGKRWCSLNLSDSAWQRIIIEKPFGTDLASAASLNRALGRVFEEEAIYRIDHYLGKELVQNIAVMRFANTIFEPIWNRNYVDHVQVTAAETVGVGSRAANYYDSGAGGALRDMVQSHLLQVLALVAMEPPSVFDAGGIMREKIAIFSTAVIAQKDQVPGLAAFGRYGPGPGPDDLAYVDEKGVDPKLKNETFAAIRVEFDNWRWNGVPFYLRSGKKMAGKLTEVVITFKPAPTNMFRKLGVPSAAERGSQNRIVINIAPTEGISLRVDAKVPGGGLKISSAKLDLDYGKVFGEEQIEAYGPLILDAIEGDRSLYKHRDEVEGSWRICEPFIKNEQLRSAIETYAPGSWGPPGADLLLGREGREWHNPRPDEVR